MLELFDNRCGAHRPLNSVYKLQAIINRATTAASIEWTLVSLADSFRMGFTEAGDCSVGKLNRETVELHLLKRAFHQFLLAEFSDKHPYASRPRPAHTQCWRTTPLPGAS